MRCVSEQAWKIILINIPQESTITLFISFLLRKHGRGMQSCVQNQP
jgi:hypothetical protein